MAQRSPIARLTDIVEASALIRSEMLGVPLEAFEADTRKRWIIERGVEIVSEASRRLPDDLKARHPEIPWPKVAAIGNVLRHNYEDIAAEVMWAVVRDDLPPLEEACRTELAAAEAAEQQTDPRLAATLSASKTAEADATATEDQKQTRSLKPKPLK
jgi:uncharacterized protein with HEPN domain